MQFFRKPAVILGSFVGFKAIQVCYSLSIGLDDTKITLVRFLALLFYAVVSYLAFREKKFALWFIGIILVVHIFGVFIGLFVISMEQYILKIVFVVLSLYFTYGGIVLIRLAKELSPNHSLQRTR